MRGSGTIRVGDRTFSVDGLGLRDHSWGPRYWQNYWYRWLPMAFTEDFALVVSIIALANGQQRRWGMVLRRDASGNKEYVPVDELELDSEYDGQQQAIAQTLRLRTREREYLVTGKSLSLVPLRNRRETDDGRVLFTRITEAMTEFRSDGLVGYGMSEYLDQIVDGVPVGRPT